MHPVLFSWHCSPLFLTAVCLIWLKDTCFQLNQLSGLGLKQTFSHCQTLLEKDHYLLSYLVWVVFYFLCSHEEFPSINSQVVALMCALMLFLLLELFWLFIWNWAFKDIFWPVTHGSRQSKLCQWLQSSLQYFCNNTKDTGAESVFSSHLCWTYQTYNAVIKGLKIPGSQMIYALVISPLW